jgi:hypothetical protein
MSQENVEVARRWMEERPLPDGITPMDFIDAGGDAVLMLMRIETEVQGTVHTLRHGSVFRVKDSKVVDWKPYASEQGAREAVGLFRARRLGRL